MTKNVAVTGATGFLGSHVTSALCERGYNVTAYVRDSQKASNLPDAVRVVVGDICDESMAASAVEGCDLVIHTVSNFRTASGPPESYHAINVDGTNTMLKAAEAAGVDRFVHVSTIGVHGHVRSTPASEDAPFHPGDLYQETKLIAERRVLEVSESSNMEVVVVRPCSIYGPGDLRMLKMFSMLSKGTFFKVGPCRENFHAVYISDVVAGILLAAETPGVNGEAFFIGGSDYLPLEEYIDTAAEAVGAAKPRVRLPYWLLISMAWVLEKTLVPMRIEPPLHVRRVRFFKNNRAFDISKARRMLKFSPKVTLEEGMRKTVLWYREKNLLPASSSKT